MTAVVVPRPGDREQQEEERDARNRVEHAGSTNEDGNQPAAGMGEDGEADRDGEPGEDRHGDEEDVLERRRHVVAEMIEGVAEAEACRSCPRTWSSPIPPPG